MAHRAAEPPPGAAGPELIQVRGAREHNLRGVDADLPRDSLVVITGLSGSGKSSLAFDTIYQEGQRRFMESLSSYARQFLGSMEKPRVDRVDGLSPTLCIDQKTVNRNPRSTVGTITEILDHLRLFMARLGEPRCPDCGVVLSRSSPGDLAAALLRDESEARLHVMAPIVQERKGEYRKELADALRDGWLRARVDGRVLHLEDDAPIELARYEKHTIELVVDRLKARPESRVRLVEAIERAAALAEGTVTFLVQGPEDPEPRHLLRSLDRSCPLHGHSAPEMEPRLFSFNAPQGMCPDCAGLGYLEDFDIDLLLDVSAPARACFGPLRSDEKLPFSSVSREAVDQIAKQRGFPAKAPFSELSQDDAEALLFGDPELSYRFTRDRGGATVTVERPWPGTFAALRQVWHYTKLSSLSRWRRRVSCSGCGGARLRPLARAVRFTTPSGDEVGIGPLSRLSIADARAFFDTLELPESQRKLGGPIVSELRARLRFLDQVGLSYLSLDRSAATLSGGEAQRIRLAAQVGAGLQGVTYVLDEPSIGLHGRDQARLLDALEALRDKGNSVIVVEHDPLTMARADHLIEVGPGAGVEGGKLVASGRPRAFLRTQALTARFLRGEERIPLPAVRRPVDGPCIKLEGASGNNLHDVDLRIPLGCLTVITGVSGSGKSTLIDRTLARALAAELQGATQRPDPFRALHGVDQLDKLVRIDQNPIGRTPRSNPATYTGAFDHIRALFAQLPESRARGYTKSRFSFNLAGGRCEECKGAGLVTVEMQFLADVQIPCEACGGKRFNAETLDIHYRGRTITDVLQMSIAQAAAFFGRHRKLKRVLSLLCEVGLGYISLGQPSTTLSGGEAQRIKLASELARPATGRTLYILDEPTTGLHMKDVGRLLDALQRLVDQGNTVVVIEHDADVIKCADHLVDLGPEGGTGGGHIVTTGTPEHVAAQDSPTGRMLAPVLAREHALEAAESAAAEPPPLLFAPPRRSSRPRAQGPRRISLRGVQTHNLRNIDVDLPEGALTVITGPSGSGKTSLAFDTLFAEGQRRYVESLSTYARRFLGRMDRPPVERVEGLAPAIAIDQRNGAGGPRSTVATTTELYDQLRLLYARVGKPHCPQCARPLRAMSPSRAARVLQADDPGAGWLVCSVPEDTRLIDLQRDGYARLWEDRELDLEELMAAEGAEAAVGERALVVDRLNPARAPLERLSEAVATAYGWGNERARFIPRARARREQPVVLSRRPDCPDHGAVLPDEITPRHFSFNSHWGACTDCGGLGRTVRIDDSLVVVDLDRGFDEALEPQVAGGVLRSSRNRALVDAVFAHFQTPRGAPARSWSRPLRRALLHGHDAPLSIQFSRAWGGRTVTIEEERDWPGVLRIVEGWGKKAQRLRRETTCASCEGQRLQPWLLAVTLGDDEAEDGRPRGRNISELCALTVEQARSWWSALAPTLGPAESAIAAQPIAEVQGRLRFLDDVGLGYLSLDRPARSLSGGEAQRIRLATQLGTSLTGTIYVLDEPTIGLHPRDTARLLHTLQGLRDLGNSLVVVEHDPEVMRAADHLIDMGPGAGEHGGRVVSHGSPAAVAADPASLTGQFLSGARAVPRPCSRRSPKTALSLPPATVHNLHEVQVDVPLGALTVVTGVSGSGKSSLVMHHLRPHLEGLQAQTGGRRKRDALRLVVVDQAPIGRSPRSTPATYTDIWNGIRKLYAQTRLARERGWTPSRFSWNTKGGRCEHCEGRGAVLIEMHFLSDVWMPCEHCGGRRFSRETLEVRWKDHSIADLLELPAEEALPLFQNQRRIHKRLAAMVDVGLGYLRLGQPATTLSGGEAQRMKLASELVSRKSSAVYLLDEPTTGLHLADVEKLLEVLHRLVDQGHTVVVIEHNVDVIDNADHVIDMGPEGGNAGGTVVFAGTPEELRGHPTSHTGAALRTADAALAQVSR
jgi:excinuclease ABC subunit A